jgi:hypothetical protein
MSPASFETTCSRTRTPTKPHLRHRLLPQLLDPIVLFPSRCLQLRHALYSHAARLRRLPRRPRTVTSPVLFYLRRSSTQRPAVCVRVLCVLFWQKVTSPPPILLERQRRMGDTSSTSSPRAATADGNSTARADGRRIVRLF